MKPEYYFLGGTWFAPISINFLSSTYDGFRFKPFKAENISFKCKLECQRTEINFQSLKDFRCVDMKCH